MQNQFYKVMNAYSDDELLAVYRDRSSYTPEATEAMEHVLSERNLKENASQIVNEQEIEETISQIEQYAKFKRSEFGKSIPDSAFAKECLKDSIYLERYISPVHNYNWLNYVFVILGGVGLVIALCILGIGEYPSPMVTFLITSIAASTLLPFGLWKLYKNKARLTIVKTMNSAKIVITGAKDYHEISLPLRYEYYWEWHTIKRNLKQVMLHIFLYDDKNDSSIELRQLIELYKSPPPHWEKLPKDFKTNKSSSFAYLNHGFQKPFLYEVQRILDGLHEED